MKTMTRLLLTVLFLTVVITPSDAQKARQLKDLVQPAVGSCALGVVTYDWNFDIADHGLFSIDCDAGGTGSWEWGPTGYVPDAPGQVWGTVLEGNYLNDSAHGLRSPSFTVDEQSDIVEVVHYFDVEVNYDGCNVTLQPFDVVLTPDAGYTVSEISPDGNYYAYCVDGEPGWTGASGVWRVDCFDLSAYAGFEVSLQFDFGSDVSVTGPGWYLARVTVGGEAPQPGVCCFLETGDCQLLLEEVCLEMGGAWHPELSDCSECPDPCFMDYVSVDWDFSVSSHGFFDQDCDNSGLSAWAYGATGYIPGTTGNVWGTVLAADYFNETGQGLVSPTFTVTPQSYRVEVYHYFDIEQDFDGCNVSVGLWPSSQVITPVAGYTVPVISPSPSFYAWCVEGEPGWTGSSNGWRVDCFDLSAFMDQEISLEFDFGSDASVTAPGWYLSRVRVGGDTPQAFEPKLLIGEIRNPEPWNDWVGPDSAMIANGVFEIPLTLYHPDPGNEITHVEFYWESNDEWVLLGTDSHGTEPRFDTVDQTDPVGDGWSLVATLPLPIPQPVLNFKATAYSGAALAPEDHFGASIYDQEPPDLAKLGVSDWETFDEDTLGLPVDPGGTEVDSVIVFIRVLFDVLDKGVPGISQQSHSETHCTPTATAQCLKYFEQERGDVTITGGLGDHPLVDALAAYMGTNMGVDPGTYLSGWVGGLADWVGDHGAGYNLRVFKHYDENGNLTWTQEDWRRMRDQLQRGMDVLVGVSWEVSPGVYRGGHSMTFTLIENYPLQNGRYIVGFKDPWTGTTSFGDIDPATGHIESLGGAGAGGNAQMIVTLVLSPWEIQPGNPWELEAVYEGVNPWPDPILVEFPEFGTYFVDVVVVNTSGHAHRNTRVVVHEEPSAAPGDGEAPMRARLGFATPNPFRESTALAYAMPGSGHVTMGIYDVTGRRVRTLLDEVVDGGHHAVAWDGLDDGRRPVAAGVYYVRMVSGDFDQTRTLTLIK